MRPNADMSFRLGIASWAMLAAPALAGQVDSAATANPGDIVVTAQRREQRLLDVPLAVSAVSGEQLQDRGVQRLSDLQTSIPGLWIVETTTGSERLQLRGVSQQVGLPTVAVYIDEVNVNPGAVGSGISVRAIDLERIEVLRGPQATLYGEGSMGGTVRYITAKPDLDNATGRVNAQVGDVQRNGGTAWLVEGAASVPLVPGKLAARIAGAYEENGGWVTTGLGNAANNGRFKTLRGSLLYDSGEVFDGSLVYLYQDSRQDDGNYARDDGSYFYPDAIPMPARNTYHFGNAVINFDLDFATLTSSTGFLDIDNSSDNFFPFAFPLPGGALLPLSSKSRSVGQVRRWTQEFRLVSQGEGPFNWLLGGLYTDDRIRSGFSTAPFPDSTPFTDLATSRVWSFYGEGSYRFAERFTLLAGGRYFQNRRSNNNNTEFRTFRTFNPRFNISYDTGAGNIYANVAKGFRSGGFNDPDLVLPGEEFFEPEKLWSYEVGAKQELLGRTLTVDFAVYYNDYQDIQSILLPTNNQPQQGRTINSGRAQGFGVDLGLTVTPIENFVGAITIGFNDVKYKTESLAVLPGDPLDNRPRWTISTSLDYRRPISDTATMFGRVDLGFSDSFVSTLRLLDTLPIVQRDGRAFPGQIRVNSRETVNARLGVEFGGLQIYAFGQNLTDNFEAVYAGGVIQTAEGARPRPRTLGVGAAFRF